MKKKIILLLSFVFYLTACKITKSIPGRYISKLHGYTVDLTLMPDSTFQLFDQTAEATKTGKGTWKLKKPDTLVLTCRNIHPFLYTITQDYLAGEILKFKILKNDKLGFYKAKLKKVR